MATVASRCGKCGGAIGEDGRTLTSAELVVAPTKRTAHEDPLEDITPAEQFLRAVERRDALIRERPTSDGAQTHEKIPRHSGAVLHK
jgi:hypothetical protein